MNRRTFIQWIGSAIASLPFVGKVKAEEPKIRIHPDVAEAVKYRKHPLEDHFDYFWNNCPEPPDHLRTCDRAEWYVMEFDRFAKENGVNLGSYAEDRCRALRVGKIDNGMTVKSEREGDYSNFRYRTEEDKRDIAERVALLQANPINKLLTEFVVKHSRCSLPA